MEAPKKVYIHVKGGKALNTWNSVWIGVNDIEYARTDVFIEKACEFINKANLYLYHCISEECDLVDTNKMINDFKNYMKGE